MIKRLSKCKNRNKLKQNRPVLGEKIRKLRKWKRRMHNMNFSNKKYENVFHVLSRGKGEDADIVLTYIDFDCDFRYSISIEKAKEFINYINMAIEDCERRKLLKNDEDE